MLKRAAFGRPSRFPALEAVPAVHTFRVMRLLSLVTVLLAALIALPIGGEARARPSVTVTRVVPLTVKGSRFVAGERVKVVVRVPRVHRKIVKAGRRGRFLVIFRVAAAKCTTIEVVATGNRGSRATATVPPTCGS
jgi:hypothetical protein